MSTRMLVTECFDGNHAACKGYNGPSDNPNFTCDCDCHSTTNTNKQEWIACRKQRPPEGVVVDTKIDDRKGIRNEQPMYFLNDLWWIGSDKDAMYVYYNPTHWRMQ